MPWRPLEGSFPSQLRAATIPFWATELLRQYPRYVFYCVLRRTCIWSATGGFGCLRLLYTFGGTFWSLVVSVFVAWKRGWHSQCGVWGRCRVVGEPFQRVRLPLLMLFTFEGTPVTWGIGPSGFLWPGQLKGNQIRAPQGAALLFWWGMGWCDTPCKECQAPVFRGTHCNEELIRWEIQARAVAIFLSAGDCTAGSGVDGNLEPPSQVGNPQH